MRSIWKIVLPSILIVQVNFLSIYVIHASEVKQSKQQSVGTDMKDSHDSSQLFGGYKKALPGYKYKFPFDHGSHPEFKTEWWYFTGHLSSASRSRDKREFGYELTFFRVGNKKDGQKEKTSGKENAWSVNDLYLAHFAISDINNKKFVFYDKINRSGINYAGAKPGGLDVHLENWYVRQRKSVHGGEEIELYAKSGGDSIKLNLGSLKQATIHGIDGVSQKASCLGCASHYYSLTRLKTNGVITIAGNSYPVSGNTWMDHEFGSNQLTSEQIGWDWFAIQIEGESVDDDSEIMLYVMRRQDGSLDLSSSGTIIFQNGSCRHLLAQDFKIVPTAYWQSPNTLAKYPASWNISIPKYGLELKVTPRFENQELNTKNSTGVTYWEGACKVEGRQQMRFLKGKAYVELTGYGKIFNKKI